MLTSLTGTKQYNRGKQHDKGKQYDMIKATSMTKTTQHYSGKAPWEWQTSMTAAGSSTKVCGQPALKSASEQGKQWMHRMDIMHNRTALDEQTLFLRSINLNLLHDFVQVSSYMVRTSIYIHIYISYWKQHILYLLIMWHSFAQRKFVVNLYIWNLGMVYLSFLIDHEVTVLIRIFTSSFIHSLQAEPNLDLGSWGG